MRRLGSGAHLGEAAAVLGHDLGIGTLQLPDDLKTLVELREDVDHGAGEEGVLGRLLELEVGGKGGVEEGRGGRVEAEEEDEAEKEKRNEVGNGSGGE